MNDDNQAPAAGAKVPIWYWAAAIGALLFECAGAYLFTDSLSLDPAMLPLDQRALYDATPQWMTIIWAVAIGTGLVGALGLILRRRFSALFLLASTVAVAGQLVGILLIQQLRELMPEDQFILQVVIFFVAYAFWQTARLASRRGWLR